MPSVIARNGATISTAVTVEINPLPTLGAENSPLPTPDRADPSTPDSGPNGSVMNNIIATNTGGIPPIKSITSAITTNVVGARTAWHSLIDSESVALERGVSA